MRTRRPQSHAQGAVNGRGGATSAVGTVGLQLRGPEWLARFHAAAVALTSADTVEEVLKRIVHSARSLAHADHATLTMLEPHLGRDRVLWSGRGDAARVTFDRELVVRNQAYAVLRLATARSRFSDEEQALIELLCAHAGLAIELVELRGCAEALRRVRALVAEPPAARHLDVAAREVGIVRVDLARHEVFVRTVPLHLTPSEFRLLELLTEEPGRAYTRDEIVERLWGTVEAGSPRVADVHVSRLRRKLERAGRNGRMLESVRGVGYKIVPPPTGAGDS